MAKPTLFFDSRLADAALVASSTAAGDYAAANVTDWRPYTWWKPSAMPATLTVNCGSEKAADYLLIHGHDLFTRGCSVEVRGSTDNFAASDVLVASRTPTSDAPFLVLFTAAAYRYWRVRITGPVAPSLAIVAVGGRLTLPMWLPQGFDPLGRVGIGRTNRSENGHPIGKIIEFESRTLRITQQRISWSWVRNVFVPAWQAHLRSAPFVFGWDVDAFPAEIQLVAAESKFEANHYAGSLCDLEFTVEGVA